MRPGAHTSGKDQTREGVQTSPRISSSEVGHVKLPHGRGCGGSALPMLLRGTQRVVHSS